MRNNPDIQVELTLLFRKLIKKLKKTYPNIQTDIQSLIDRLETGETPGTQIQGVRHTVYKVRVKNSDLSKGKSAGYRVIYYIRTANRIILISVYAKNSRTNITADEIRRLIDEI